VVGFVTLVGWPADRLRVVANAAGDVLLILLGYPYATVVIGHAEDTSRAEQCLWARLLEGFPRLRGAADCCAERGPRVATAVHLTESQD